MRLEEAKNAVKSLAEVTEGRKELCKVVADVAGQVAGAKRVFREGNKSKLIKLGVA